jgi:hypothetical protein
MGRGGVVDLEWCGGGLRKEERTTRATGCGVKGGGREDGVL